jgi:hypothetical protein
MKHDGPISRKIHDLIMCGKLGIYDFKNHLI